MHKIIYILLVSLLLYIEIVPLTYYASKVMFKKDIKESFIILFLLIIILKILNSQRVEIIEKNIKDDYFYKYVIYFFISNIITNLYFYFNDIILGLIYSCLICIIIYLLYNNYNHYLINFSIIIFIGCLLLRFYDLFNKKHNFMLKSLFLTLFVTYYYLSYFIDSLLFYKLNKN